MKDRIYWIDIARGMAILFVIFGHAFLNSNVKIVVYMFHMALFFVSGILHKERVSIYRRYCKYIYDYDTYRNNYLDNVSELRHVPTNQKIKRIH